MLSSLPAKLTRLGFSFLQGKIEIIPKATTGMEFQVLNSTMLSKMSSVIQMYSEMTSQNWILIFSNVLCNL